MARQGVIRTRKDGGCSICYAEEKNVGKRKCCHILDDASIEIRKEKGTNFIDITGKYGKESVGFSIKANEKKVKEFITELQNSLTEKEQKAIIKELRKS